MRWVWHLLALADAGSVTRGEGCRSKRFLFQTSQSRGCCTICDSIHPKPELPFSPMLFPEDLLSCLRPEATAFAGPSFSQRATKQPISHRGSWGAQTGPGTFRRQLISIIMNYNQPWATLGLAPQPQRENCDPNGSQGSANFHCIMVPGSPWSARRSPLRLQSAILTSTSDARDFVGGPEHR